MAKWFGKYFLMTGFILLLYHSLVPHHHIFDDTPTTHFEHHPFDALEHVQIEHQFVQGHASYFPVDLAEVTLLPQLYHLPAPVMLLLPEPVWLATDEPHPPGWHTDQSILRGPPAFVNAAV